MYGFMYIKIKKQEIKKFENVRGSPIMRNLENTVSLI